MAKNRERSAHGHRFVSHWAGQGLVRKVCRECHHVSIHPGGQFVLLKASGDIAPDWFVRLVGESV
jgi:hypothetical protein